MPAVRTVLVTLIGPARTADLVVDADTPVAELLPSLLAAGGVQADPASLSEWGVALTGKQPIPLMRTLEDAGVLDGSVLVVRREAPEGTGAPSVPRAGGGPAGSPLQRTRELLASGDPEGGRRGRLVPVLPDPAALAPDAASAGLEQAVRAARLARCATIAIASPKGGVGKTTLSILLGELLSTLREEAVVALDADSDYGSLGRVAPASATAAEADEVFHALAGGSVTFAELDRTLWKLPEGLRVVPSPRAPAAMARADRETYARVIGNLQRLAGILLLDCGTGLGQPGVQAAILACDQLVLVTEASGATATLTVEAMRLLERAGRPITVVCNRQRRGRSGQEDLQRLDGLFPRAAALLGVPEDPAAQYALRGEFAWAHAPRALRQAVLELAASLVLGWRDAGLEPLG